jgi:hypothetical protein
VALLHLRDVYGQSIFTSDLKTLREMVDLLKLIQALEEITLARSTAPKDIPFVRFSV